MTRSSSEIDADLTQWSDRIARMGRSIETLSQNPAFLRLKAQGRLGALTGVTKTKSAAATSAADQLWDLYLLLDKALTEAIELRKSKNPFGYETRLSQIDALLTGASITLPNDPVALTALTLDGGPKQTMSLSDIFRAMDKAFTETRDIVAAAARGWDSTKAFDQLRQKAAELANEAASLNYAPPTNLQAAKTAIDAAAAAVDADPIGADNATSHIENQIQAASNALTAARRDHEEAQAFLDAANARLLTLGQSRAKMLETRATRLAKIADPLPDSEPPTDSANDLSSWLERLTSAHAGGRSRAVVIGAQSWTKEADAAEASIKTCLASDEQLIAARNDLRGQFTALKARADDLSTQGRLTDDNAALMNQTADLLFGKPTPLPAAVQLMRRCERI